MLTTIIVVISWAMDAVTQGTHTEQFSSDHLKYVHWLKMNQNRQHDQS